MSSSSSCAGPHPRAKGLVSLRSLARPRALLAFAMAFASVAIATASGQVGIYGIVEKVVFEPNDRAPERVQVWGAFAYVDGNNPQGTVVSTVRPGYLYFKLPTPIPGFIDQTQVDNVKKEWSDLKAVAGTGQAVGFGRWMYIAGFGSLQPDSRPVAPSVILENVPRGGSQIDLRVRPESEAPSAPATYQTNTGIVKLSESGSHAAIVKALKDAIKRYGQIGPRKKKTLEAG